jgi:hypothetical protein
VSKQALIYKGLILVCFMAAAPAPAYSYEKIVYNQNLSEVSRRALTAYARDTLKTEIESLDIARADLNEDGLEEFILRPKGCGPQPCDHRLVAQAQSGVIELGTITARGLVLGNQYSSGIRTLLAFNNDNNDFDYELYVWEPRESRYILSP